MVLEKTLESPLDCTEIQPVHSEGHQIGRASCRERVETVSDFIFLGSKFTADGDYRHEIKRCLLLGIKAMTNLDRILKTRDTILATKVHIVKATVFPVMKGCDSWTIKKAERRRIDSFEL